jgi:hypothetical protein
VLAVGTNDEPLTSVSDTKSIDYVGMDRPLPRATTAYSYVVKASLAHRRWIVDIS